MNARVVAVGRSPANEVSGRHWPLHHWRNLVAHIDLVERPLRWRAPHLLFHYLTTLGRRHAGKIHRPRKLGFVLYLRLGTLAEDAGVANRQKGFPLLIGLRNLAGNEHQVAGTTRPLSDIYDLLGFCDQVSHPHGSVKRPLAPAIESIALEGKRNLEVAVLCRSEIVEAWCPVLPCSQLRTQQSTKPAVPGIGRVQIERIGIFDCVRQLEDHFLADRETIGMGAALVAHVRFDFGG